LTRNKLHRTRSNNRMLEWKSEIVLRRKPLIINYPSLSKS
jgi:hypothetical protein